LDTPYPEPIITNLNLPVQTGFAEDLCLAGLMVICCLPATRWDL